MLPPVIFIFLCPPACGLRVQLLRNLRAANEDFRQNALKAALDADKTDDSAQKESFCPVQKRTSLWRDGAKFKSRVRLLLRAGIKRKKWFLPKIFKSVASFAVGAIFVELSIKRFAVKP